MDMGKIVSKAELAQIFGCSLPTVAKWFREGCPNIPPAKGGDPYRADTAEVHAWLAARNAPEPVQVISDQTDPSRISYDEATRRKAVADAKKAELALAEATGLVIRIDTIAKVVSNEIANARARLLAVPTKFRPTAQTTSIDEASSKTIVNTVEELIRDALTEINTHGEAASKSG